MIYLPRSTSMCRSLNEAVAPSRAQVRIVNAIKARSRCSISVVAGIVNTTCRICSRVLTPASAPQAIASNAASSTPSLIAEADAVGYEATQSRYSAPGGIAGRSSLGYEVNEGIATAWLQGGQIELRKAANHGYGVELEGGTKSAEQGVRTKMRRLPAAASA